MPSTLLTGPDGADYEISHPEGASDDEIIQYAQQQFGSGGKGVDTVEALADDEPTTGEIVKGVGAEMATSVGGSIAGGVIGGALGSIVPGVGTAIGATAGTAIGGFAGGFLGSLIAQDIEGQEDVSLGRALGAGAVSAIPLGGAAAKGVAGGGKITASMVGRAAGREAVKGAALGGTEATIKTIVDEGRMPTKEEYAQYAGAGALFGGALGAATPKVSKSMDKFFGKTAREIDEGVATGDIKYEDFGWTLKDIPDTKKTPPPIPETRGQGQQFHGTSGDISGGLVSEQYSSDNIYGQGFYTTDAVDIAKGYTEKGLGEHAVIHQVNEKKPVEFFDLDKSTARELVDTSGVGAWSEVQDALDDLPESASGADLYKWIRQNIRLPKDEIQDMFYDIQGGLERRGFGGISHIGGNLTGHKPHNVKIYFDPENQLDINEFMRFDVPELTILKRKEKKLRKARADLPYANADAYKAWADELNSVVDRIQELSKPKPTMVGQGEKIIRKDIEKVISRVRSEAASQALDEMSPFKRMSNKVLSVIAPSQVVGKEARNEALNFRKRVASAEELGSRVQRRVTKAIEKDPKIAAKVDTFLDTGELNPDLGDLQDELVVYREALHSLQEELINQLEMDKMASLESGKLRDVTEKILKLEEEAKSQTGKKLKKTRAKIKKKQKVLKAPDELIATIRESKDLGTFSSREYRMFTDSEFVPDLKLRDAAVNEIAASKFKGGKGKYKTFEAARTAANKHLDDLESKSARVRKTKGKQTGAKQLYEAPLKKRHKVGEAERAWLGEITDTGEKMRGTLTRVGKLVARKQTDRNVANILKKHGLAVPSGSQMAGMQELRLKAGEATQLHTMPEVQAAINRLYLDGAQQRSSNPIIAGLQDLYSSSVGLSKATKVLLNPPSYAVQAYGNTISLLGMGVNPFSNVGKAFRLATAEYGGLEYLMSKAGREKRTEFLKEMNDMTKYGIKGENILESDIRDAFERGLFSKAMEKPIGFFGKAYSVPDTMGRYIAWKSQQDMLEKVYPGLDGESVKRLAAEVVNDTYQNYDRLSSTVKSLSRMGVMPQFASFTAEFMRNQYNQGKMIKQMLSGTFGADLGLDVSKANIKAMRAQGAKRLASLATVYGATAATISAINHDGGVTEEKELHARELMPSWDRNKSLAMRLSEDGEKISYANVSYIAPQALGLAAFDAGMSGEPIGNLAEMLISELVGDGTFINRSMMQAINNRNDRGEKISSNEDDFKNAMERMKFFLVESFKPGIAREVEKMDEALRGVGDLTTKQVWARQLGYRVTTLDFAESAKYRMMEHKDNADMSKREYTKARDEGTMRPEDLEALYQKANEARKESMALIARRNQNLIVQGYNESKRIQVMKKAGLGSKDILATLEGRYNDIPRVATPSASDRFDELTGTTQEKRRQIIEIGKTDRGLARKLMQNLKREQMNERRGINDRESLLRNMNVADRARYIIDHPNPNSYIKELRRKGIATDEVVRLVRMMQRE